MKSLLFAGVLLFAPLLSAAVGNKDLEDIRVLIAAGKYEEALQKHLWFHEESKTSRGMGGVRLSFALSQWAELGKKYPPALAALKAMRDQHEKQLLAGTAGFPEFHECSAINRTLEEDEKTYVLFTQLHAKQPEIARSCFDVSLDLIVRHGNYELAGAYLGNPMRRYDQAEHSRQLNLRLMEDNPAMNNPQFRQHSDSAYVQRTAQLIDILAHLQRMDEARAIQKRSLAYFAAPEIEKALPAP